MFSNNYIYKIFLDCFNYNLDSIMSIILILNYCLYFCIDLFNSLPPLASHALGSEWTFISDFNYILDFSSLDFRVARLDVWYNFINTTFPPSGAKPSLTQVEGIVWGTVFWYISIKAFIKIRIIMKWLIKFSTYRIIIFSISLVQILDVGQIFIRFVSLMLKFKYLYMKYNKFSILGYLTIIFNVNFITDIYAHSLGFIDLYFLLPYLSLDIIQFSSYLLLILAVVVARFKISTSCLISVIPILVNTCPLEEEEGGEDITNTTNIINTNNTSDTINTNDTNDTEDTNSPAMSEAEDTDIWNNHNTNFKDLNSQAKSDYIQTKIELKGLNVNQFLINYFISAILVNTTGLKMEVDCFLNTNLTTILNDRREIQLGVNSFVRFYPFLLNNSCESLYSKPLPYKSDNAFKFEIQDELEAMTEAHKISEYGLNDNNNNNNNNN
jgi:hypothetical protein